MVRVEVMRPTLSAVPPLVLLGASSAARRLDEAIRAAAAAECVLVEGEAGLDVVEIARAIHDLSQRPGPCVVLDCSAATPALVERELFGEMARRSSGDLEAIGPRAALTRASNGTLYLGEVSELSTSAQARLARVARDREVRVGASKTTSLNISLVAALSADVESEVSEGRLRRDLLRHFTRTRIAVPGLRQRAEDIPLMVEAIVTRLCEEKGTGRKTLAPPAMTLLSAMPWHGNLVELRHALARIVADVSGELIQLEDVLAHVRFDGGLAPHAPSGTLRSARQQFERDYIGVVLRHHRGRVGDAARALGIQRTNLYRKARQLGISVARPAQ